MAYSVPRAPSFAPMSAALGSTQRVQMIYADFYTINIAISGIGGHVFAANGLYDPDITGSGHQPSGFDEYKNIYSRLTVLNSQIKVVMTGENQEPKTGRNGITWGISFLTEKNVIASDCREYIENGETVWTKNMYGETDPKTLTARVNLSKALGMNVMDRPEFDNTTTSNPGAANYWHVWIESDDGDIGNVNFTVEIRYDVLLRKNSLLALS